MTTTTQTRTIIELYEWFDDHGWNRDEVLATGATLWRWPVNDHIIEIPNQVRLVGAIALAFLAADIMHTYPESNKNNKNANLARSQYVHSNSQVKATG